MTDDLRPLPHPASGLDSVNTLHDLQSALVLIDAEKNILYANTAACEELGLCSGEKFKHANLSVVDHISCGAYEIPTPRRGKSQTISYTLIRTEWNRAPAFLLLFNRDEKKNGKNERAADQMEKMSVITRNLPGMVYRRKNDRQWTFESISEQCLSLTGYSSKELLEGKKPRYGQMIVEADRDQIWNGIQEALSNKQAFRLLYRLRRKDGLIRWMWEQGTGVYGEDGNPERLEGFIVDVTHWKQMEDERAQNDCRFQSLFQASQDAVLMIEPSGKIQTCNHRSAQMLGQKMPGDLIGTHIYDWVADEDLPLAKDKWSCVQAGKPTPRHAFRLNRPDGKPIIADISGSWMVGADGKIHTVTLVARDITNRQAEQNALFTSEARYRAIVEDNPELICRLSPKGILTFANSAFCIYAGKRLQDLIGSSIEDSMPFDRRNVLENALASQKPTLLNDGIENRIFTQDGQVSWYRWSIQPILDDTGKINEYQAIGEDITQIKAAERSIRESERRLREFLDNIKLVALIIDKQGNIIFCNQYFSQITGWKADDILGSNWFDRFLPIQESARLKSTFLEAVFSGNIPVRYQHSIIIPGGEQRLMAWTNTLVRNLQGEMIGVASIGEDITERQWADRVQAAIYRISQAANSSPSLNDLYRQIHQILRELMPAENLIIALYDTHKELLSFPYVVDQYDEPPKQKKPGRGLTEYVLRTGESLLAPPAVFERLVEEGEVESIGTPSVDWLGVPLKTDDRTIGVIATQTYTEGVRFTYREEQVLSFVSTQIAMAIERRQAEDALRSSQQRYQALVEACTDAIFLEKVDGKILDCNAAALNMFGYTYDEMIHLSVQDLLPEEIRDQVIEIMNAKIAEGGYLVEGVNRKKDGQIIPVEVSTRLTVIDDQQVVVAFIRDTTERIQAQHALVESESKFRTLAETTSAGIFILRNNRCLYANPGWCSITGYDQEESLVMDFDRLALAEDRENYRQIVQGWMKSETKKHQRIEVRIISKSGEIKWLDISAGLIEYEGQQSIMGTAVDISARKHVEEQMGLQSTALESAANAIVITNPLGEVSWVNESFKTLTGYSKEEIINKKMSILHSGKQPAEYYDQMWTTIRSGQVWRGELINRRKDGSEYPEEMTITPVRNASNEIAYFIAIKQNISSRRLRERELEAIARLSSALRTAVTRSEIVPAILEETLHLLGVDGGLISLYNSNTGRMFIELGIGVWRSLTGRSLPPGKGLAYHVVSTSDMYFNDHASDDPYFAFNEFKDDLQSLAAVPLIIQGRSIGALIVGSRGVVETSELRMLTAIGDIAASGIHRADLFDQTRLQATELAYAYDATIEGWAHALELRDRETQGHSQRIASLTLNLARALGINESAMVHIRRGALLHDIGKMGIPDQILLKPGPLTDDEWKIMRMHPVYANEMLADIPYLQQALEIPYCHHEWWDGTGYPRRLKGEQIPLAARIFAIVDTWDALVSDRVYRSAWSEEKALAHIQERSGSHFDPQVVRVFTELLKAGRL